MPRRKHLQWDLLVMPITLKAIRSIRFKIFSENKTFFHLSMSYVWCSLANSKWASLWHWRRCGLWRHFLFFKPFSCRCHLGVIGLQSTSVRGRLNLGRGNPALNCASFVNKSMVKLSEKRTKILLTKSGTLLKIKFIHSFLTLGSEGRQCKYIFFHNLALHNVLLCSEHLYRLVSA